jgi:hypothetical protein
MGIEDFHWRSSLGWLILDGLNEIDEGKSFSGSLKYIEMFTLSFLRCVNKRSAGAIMIVMCEDSVRVIICILFSPNKVR